MKFDLEVEQTIFGRERVETFLLKVMPQRYTHELRLMIEEEIDGYEDVRDRCVEALELMEGTIDEEGGAAFYIANERDDAREELRYLYSLQKRIGEMR